MDLNELLNGLMADMRKVADTASMIGEPVKVGSSHMVPLLDVTIGFGTAATDLSGSGDTRGGRIDGSGAGGTMVVTPKAFVVIDADGVPQLVTLKDGKYGAVQKAIVLEPSAQALPENAPPKLPSGGGSHR
ncbi:MAG TPA: spore germination protein GerW family protein [Labilithrix sp.]|nr:spore germination protein GerW family protein [Labilithrix sp.]